MNPAMSDEELLAHLSAVLADDKPPSDAMEAAYAAFGWRTLDADLAQLIEDSQLEVVMFRQGSHARLLAYESEHGSIELGVDDHSVEITVLPAVGSVVLHRPWGPEGVDLDANGRATVEVASGPLRIAVRWPRGETLTPWTTL